MAVITSRILLRFHRRGAQSRSSSLSRSAASTDLRFIEFRRGVIVPDYIARGFEYRSTLRQCQDSSVGICLFVDATDVNEIDPSTLTLLCGPDGLASDYAKDKNHVYAFYVDGPAVLPGADPASFQVISPYPWWWVKDKDHVWCGGTWAQLLTFIKVLAAEASIIQIVLDAGRTNPHTRCVSGG